VNWIYSKDARINQSLRRSVRDGAAYSVMAGAGETYFSAYALFYKATSAQISVLAALPALFGSIAQLLSAWLGSLIPSRKRLILAGVLVQTVAWLPIIWLPYLFPAQAVPILIGCSALYFMGAHLAAPPWNSLMGDLVPERRRGRFFGRRSRLMMLTHFTAMLAAGGALHLFEAGGHERLGFTLIFLVAAVARAYSAAQLARMHEPPYQPQPLRLPPLAGLLPRLRESDFARFTIFFACFNLTVALSSPFFTVYMLRDLKFSYLEFTLSTGAAVLTQFSLLGLWGRITDIYGNRLVLRLTGGLIPIFPALWLVSPSFWYILLLQIGGGVCWSGFSLAANNYLYDSVPREKRTGYAAIHQVLSNGTIFAGALLGGYLTTVIPEQVTVLERTVVWTSSLWGVLLLSTLGRAVMASVFLPRLREVRAVRPMSAGELAFRLVRLNAVSGLLSELFSQRRTRV
jgi:MFS family permease